MTAANSSTTSDLIQAVRDHALENFDSAEGWSRVVEAMDDEAIADVIGKVRTPASAINKVKLFLADLGEYSSQGDNYDYSKDVAYDDAAESGPVVDEVTIAGADEVPATVEEPKVAKAAPAKRVYTDPRTNVGNFLNYVLRPSVAGVRQQRWGNKHDTVHADIAFADGGCLKSFKNPTVKDREWLEAAFAAEVAHVEAVAPETGETPNRNVYFCTRCVIQMRYLTEAPAPKVKAAKSAKAAPKGDKEVIDGVDLGAKFVSDADQAAMDDAEIAAAKADAADKAAIAAAVASEEADAALLAGLQQSIEEAPAKLAAKAARKAKATTAK